MKTSFFSTILFIFVSIFASNLAAQNDNQASFETYLKKVYTAYETEPINAVDKFYTENASEIGPDGSLTIGRKALGESWKQLQGMMDAKPQFTYQLTSWRLIKPDLALITWDSHDKFFMFGQTMEKDNTCAALLRKEKGQWLIEYDHLTPKVPFPDPKADELAIKALGNEAYAAIAARDAARFAACYTEEVDMIAPFGNLLKGRKTLEMVYSELFKQWANMPEGKVEINGMNIRFISPDVAICQWSQKETSEIDGKPATEEVSLLNACQRVNGQWKVAAMSITPVRPIPGM
ncbi:MAG: SgcJ/EcaC family oxidoreductase [Saprospiraceae bacterium]|nr:SgcJ/EcaC family oxidoreductase [Saprospiraceae bacterium]